MNRKLVWIELRTHDFIRTIEFYESVLNVSFEVKFLYRQRIALFDEDEMGMRGCIIESHEQFTHNSVVLFFKVEDFVGTLQKVIQCGGKVIRQPEIVKRRDQDGRIITEKNLFDDEIGYLSEINDPAGNTVFLYSNTPDNTSVL